MALAAGAPTSAPAATVDSRARRGRDLLAQQLTVLIDGGLASGVLDADPATPPTVKAPARTLVDAACPVA
ncbi:hypothetical protein ACFPER_02200 [Agromyces aurantiacus]|uniref:TetR family transcriptional regulator n=1 Tax=Agromyces aurantiacus TaxID=165814 RepID=A0ABV9R2Y1_9MICO|nr:hypothetical protein [Agromyces aurantiacus]MBM7505899.1 hypothetical protein [Agromyces aurantiacus]